MSHWMKFMLCLALLGCANDARTGLAFMDGGPARRVAIEPFVGGGEIEGLALPCGKPWRGVAAPDQPHRDRPAHRRHAPPR